MLELKWAEIRADPELQFTFCRNEQDLKRAADRMRKRLNYFYLFGRSFGWSAEQEFGPEIAFRYLRQFKPDVVDISPSRPRRRVKDVIVDPQERRRANRRYRRNAPNWSETEFVRLCVGMNRYFQGVDWAKARIDPELPSLICIDDATLDQALHQAKSDGSLADVLLSLRQDGTEYSTYDHSSALDIALEELGSHRQPKQH